MFSGALGALSSARRQVFSVSPEAKTIAALSTYRSSLPRRSHSERERELSRSTRLWRQASEAVHRRWWYSEKKRGKLKYKARVKHSESQHVLPLASMAIRVAACLATGGGLSTRKRGWARTSEMSETKQRVPQRAPPSVAGHAI